jgi:hypothetical protein
VRSAQALYGVDRCSLLTNNLKAEPTMSNDVARAIEVQTTHSQLLRELQENMQQLRETRIANQEFLKKLIHEDPPKQ